MLIRCKNNEWLSYEDTFKEQFNSTNVKYYCIGDFVLAKKIQLSKVFEPVIENGEVIDINIVKSYEQYLLEHPKPPTPFEKAKGKYNAADKASLNHMDIVKRIEILEELLMLKEG